MIGRICLSTPLLLLLCISCATTYRYIEPKTPLERAIYLTEIDDGGKPHGISSVDPDTQTVTRIPSPAAVDISSRIEVEILKRQLLYEGNDKVAKQLEDLEQRQKALTQMLGSLTNFLGKRELALEAYRATLDVPMKVRRQSEAFRMFDVRRKEMAAAELQLIDQIERVWPEDHPRRAEVEAKAVTLTKEPDFQQLLQDELDHTQMDYRQLVRSVTLKLRLEAFLRSPGKEVIPIHLEGYDTLPEGKLERRDRLGLILEGSERDRFNDLVKQANMLATAAERVRTGEESLNEAFQEVSSTLFSGVGGLATEIIELSQDLEFSRLDDRIKRTDRAIATFGTQVKERFQETASEAVDQLLGQGRRAIDSLRQEVGRTTNIADLLQCVSSLRSSLEHWRPEKLPTLLLQVEDLQFTLSKVLESFRISPDIIISIEKDILTVFERFPESLRFTLEKEWDSSEAKLVFEEWKDLLERTQSIVQQVEDMRNVFNFAPLPAGIRVPEALDVPLEDAPNTFIDLEMTPRLEADRINLHARVLDGEREVYAPYRVSFDVRRFGWHAWMDPSVVLVKPEELAGEQENFRFAPVLSWLHTYHPRPEESSWHSNFWRATGFAGGIHSAFLNFDTNKEVEIGLGITIGLWDGILQGGMGWNLMAEERDEGQTYYFIGSSLIPLLQALGEK
jgi:hypothetical protein